MWSLATLHEVPPWLRFNRYILGGYRRQMTPMQALRSLFMLHNETVNVWSHFLPALVLLWLVVFPPEMLSDPLIRLCVGSFVFIFSASTIYHSFMPCCHSAEDYRRLICGDVLGSLLSISVTAYSFILRGNRCRPEWETMIIAGGFAAYSLALLYVILFSSMTVGQRFALFGSHCVLRLLICLHVTHGKLEAQPELQHGAYYHALSFFTILTGGLLNVSRFPECVFGRRWRWLDYVGNSHNLWHYACVHSCLLAAVGCWFDHYEWKLTNCALQQL